MKNLIQYILTGFFCVVAFSCSNDFLNDESDISTTPGSQIFISPQWEAADYSITVQNAGNSKFTVVKYPDWLQVNTISGQFNNNVASVNCRASVCNDFSKVGIYNSSMILDLEGKGKTLIPLLYIVEGNPTIQTESNLTLQFGYYTNHVNLTVRNTGDGILLWGIAEKPEWITINFPNGLPLPERTLYLIPQNQEINLDVFYSSTSIPANDLNGKIVIASNDKNHSTSTINVSLDLGTPSLYWFTDEVNFGRTETTQAFYFSNHGDGLLIWEIESCPEWLSVSETSGMLNPYNWQNLSFTCNKSLLPNGQQTHTIYLKTNDKNNPSSAIKVTAVGYNANPENIKAINGIVTDAWIDKSSDILYLTTNQPNRLLAYNVKTKTIDKELSLSKAPTCFSVSEDGKQAVIGHNRLISRVDMNLFSVTKTLEVEFAVFDIEFGANNWCCYSREDEEYYYLPWINLESEEKYYSKKDNYGFYHRIIIKKIPYQDYIFALNYYSFYLFNAQSRDFIRSYGDDNGTFWFSQDGKYLFCNWNKIYRTSSLIPDDYVLSYEQFYPAPYYICWLDYAASSHSVWILSSSLGYDYWGNDSPREIQQYEDNDFTRVNTYYYDDYYNGNFAQAQYVFANSAGNEIVVIKNNIQNAWAIEHIPVTK